MYEDFDRTRYNVVREYDKRRSAVDDTEALHRARDLEKQMPRLHKWRVGDVYSPNDLGSVEARKWMVRRSVDRDAFDVLGINPLKEYKVCASR